MTNRRVFYQNIPETVRHVTEGVQEEKKEKE